MFDNDDDFCLMLRKDHVYIFHVDEDLNVNIFLRFLHVDLLNDRKIIFVFEKLTPDHDLIFLNYDQIRKYNVVENEEQ
ncbi:hypothetical protein [Nostoc phage YongM]|nr:hypothetical protein [Nostoc phage YongM]